MPSTWSNRVSSSSAGTGPAHSVSSPSVVGWTADQPNGTARTSVEFTWEGVDEGDQVSGRGWAVLVDDETIEGHLFFRLGDDSTFRAEPFTPAD